MTRTLAAFSGALLAAGTISAAGWAHNQSSGTNKHNVRIGEPRQAALLVDPNGDRVAFEPGSGQLIADWNRELIKIEQTPGAQPASVHPTRSYALLQTAEYDAVVSITEADDPYAFSVVAPRGARPDAAANQAAHDVLRDLFPSFAPQLDSMLANELASVPEGPGKAEGLTVGARAATILLALRANDGSGEPQPTFVPGSQPGDYQITPPNNAPAVFTGWGKVTPWALDAGHQFRPPPPPPLSSSQWAAAINQVQSVGEDSSTTRTADETTVANFWAPPIWNTWNEIADGQIVDHRTNLEDASHVLSVLNITLADSAIGFYDAKYHFQLWRPVTAIRAGTPGNALVDPANPTWLPQAHNTAPDPSYPAAHATVSEAAATVLTAFYGDGPLTVSSDALPGTTRGFSNFQAAAREAGLSRIFAGQHTRIDVSAGDNLGHQIAEFVLEQPYGD